MYTSHDKYSASPITKPDTQPDNKLDFQTIWLPTRRSSIIESKTKLIPRGKTSRENEYREKSLALDIKLKIHSNQLKNFDNFYDRVGRRAGRKVHALVSSWR